MSLTAQSQTRKLVTGNKLSDVSERRRDSSLIIIDKTVCKRIIYYRQKLKLSQEELASNVGINLKHLIKIEAGLKIPRINELVQLATGLGISIDELVNNK
ncbi:helix-turn-helix domain-containing protein [Desulfosporosinus metallidurans]|uniref:helix-turn-helix domain-containing protein n=1 Tax=Desulfosporosinus metallidurans TaxID=1888891 RepID=UPI000A5DB405|nr:helix-turn-helix transcriptional regulator [Desulfosporosinus metallidurans]